MLSSLFLFRINIVNNICFALFFENIVNNSDAIPLPNIVNNYHQLITNLSENIFCIIRN